MKNDGSKEKGIPTIRKLYPTLTEAEQKEAEANFRRYAEIAVEIQRAQAASDADFDTALDRTTMKERSNSLKS